MKLVAVLASGKKYQEYIKVGYSVHHVDSNFGRAIVYLAPPKLKVEQK